jgi:hypothetical protein
MHEPETEAASPGLQGMLGGRSQVGIQKGLGGDL